jgi:hypothetical protein
MINLPNAVNKLIDIIVMPFSAQLKEVVQLGKTRFGMRYRNTKRNPKTKLPIAEINTVNTRLPSTKDMHSAWKRARIQALNTRINK